MDVDEDGPNALPPAPLDTSSYAFTGGFVLQKYHELVYVLNTNVSLEI